MFRSYFILLSLILFCNCNFNLAKTFSMDDCLNQWCEFDNDETTEIELPFQISDGDYFELKTEKLFFYNISVTFYSTNKTKWYITNYFGNGAEVSVDVPYEFFGGSRPDMLDSCSVFVGKYNCEKSEECRVMFAIGQNGISRASVSIDKIEMWRYFDKIVLGGSIGNYPEKQIIQFKYVASDTTSRNKPLPFDAVADNHVKDNRESCYIIQQSPYARTRTRPPTTITTTTSDTTAPTTIIPSTTTTTTTTTTPVTTTTTTTPITTTTPTPITTTVAPTTVTSANTVLTMPATTAPIITESFNTATPITAASANTATPIKVTSFNTATSTNPARPNATASTKTPATTSSNTSLASPTYPNSNASSTNVSNTNNNDKKVKKEVAVAESGSSFSLTDKNTWVANEDGWVGPYANRNRALIFVFGNCIILAAFFITVFALILGGCLFKDVSSDSQQLNVQEYENLPPQQLPRF